MTNQFERLFDRPKTATSLGGAVNQPSAPDKPIVEVQRVASRQERFGDVAETMLAVYGSYAGIECSILKEIASASGRHILAHEWDEVVQTIARIEALRARDAKAA